MHVVTLQNRWSGGTNFRQGETLYYWQQMYHLTMSYPGPVGKI
jgi:hypothetical protein